MPQHPLRLVSYRDPSSHKECVGVQTGTPGAGVIHPLPFASMLELIEKAPASLETVRTEAAKSSGTLPEATTQLLAPVPHPVSLRDGYAFRQHVESARKGRGLPMIPEFDLFPIFYFTNHLNATGPGPVTVMPRHLERLDFELEAAVVIGKPGRNLTAANADNHIFGYMIWNDWSARQLQTEEMKLNLGPAKGKDFASSFGPYLIPREDLKPFATQSPVGERHSLRMQAFVNGKQVSDSNLNTMTWTFAQLLERASYGVTLQIGEVIGSGTCGTGCFMELNATGATQDWWLKVGDKVVLEIDQLGRLENTITAEEMAR